LTTWRPFVALSVFSTSTRLGALRSTATVLLTIVAAAKPSEVFMKHTTKYYGLKEITAILQKRAHVVEYALANGIVAEPKLRIAGKRVFSTADLRRLATHFKVKLPAGETVGL
jgi:hypothetical protein